MIMKKLLNQKEISKLTGLSRHEVFLLLRTGDLFGVKLGKGWRVREDVLADWMDKTFTPTPKEVIDTERFEMFGPFDEEQD